MIRKQTFFSMLGLVAALATLLFAYLPVLQTIPNGSENYFMIDVGETQIVLNRWGTLHATGYPLYVMIGSGLVALLRAFGLGAATAPAVVSLIWGLLTLTLIYVLALHLTRRFWLAAGITILFGLTRTMWIHNDIAEVYTMTMFFLVLLLLLALWQPPIKGRIFWLALIGGIGVAHHRAILMVAPALIFAVWPDLIALIRKRPILLLAVVGLGLIGLIPYGYLMLRAQQGAAWVYGQPGTLPGLIDQFMGKEADHFMGLPASLNALIANINVVNSVIVTDVTVPGVLVGLIGLVIGLFTHRRTAIVLILSGGVAYLFHCFLYDDILSPLILAATFSLAFGWLFVADGLLHWSGETSAPPDLTPVSAPNSERRVSRASLAARAAAGEDQVARGSKPRPYASVLLVVIAVLFGVSQFNFNTPFIGGLTSDTTGLETIKMAQHTPPGATLMLAWGPRYFAVGFARDVLGLLPGIRLVDHKADYKSLLADGPLVTADYTFYNQPVSWWQDKLGTSVYLRAVAPDLVQIDTMPELENDPDEQSGVVEIAHRIDCMMDTLVLRVDWHTDVKPTRDLSVFVHLLDSSGSVIAQDDHSAPVYGWRPLTTWMSEEVVRDVYTLPRLPNASAISYGLYEQRADGSFNNVVAYNLPVECG